MEIETTVDEYFDDIDLTDNVPSLHNEVNQKLVSDPSMPSLSLSMNESSKFWGEGFGEGFGMDFSLPSSTSDIFGNFNDGVVKDGYPFKIEDDNYNEYNVPWNFQASQGASPASLGTSPESQDQSVLSSSPSTSSDGAFNDVRDTELAKQLTKQKASWKCTKKQTKKSKSTTTVSANTKEDSNSKKSLRCLSKQNDATKGKELQKHLKKPNKIISSSIADSTNNKSLRRNTVNVSNQGKESKLKTFTPKFGKTEPRKTILLDHVPDINKSPTKSVKNVRSSSLNLDKATAPLENTSNKANKNVNGKNKNPPSDHDYCKRNLSDLMEKDYKVESPQVTDSKPKKKFASKKRKMTLSEYLQNSNMAKSAPVTPQHNSPKAKKSNNYVNQMVTKKSSPLKSTLTMEPNELFIKGNSKIVKKPSGLVSAAAHPKYISLQMPSIQANISKLKKAANANQKNLKASQQQNINKPGGYTRVVACKKVVQGGQGRLLMGNNNKPLKVLKPTSNGKSQQILVVPSVNGVKDNTRNVILSATDKGITDMKDYLKAKVNPKIHRQKIVETVNKGNIRVTNADIRKMIPMRNKFVQSNQVKGASRCRATISKELTLQHEIQQTNKRIVNGRKTITSINRTPVTKLGHVVNRKPALAIRSSSNGQFQRLISPQIGNPATIIKDYSLKVHNDRSKIIKTNARNKNSTILNGRNFKVLSVKNMASLVQLKGLKDLNLSITTTSKKIKSSNVVNKITQPMFDHSGPINRNKKIQIVKLSRNNVLNKPGAAQIILSDQQGVPKLLVPTNFIKEEPSDEVNRNVMLSNAASPLDDLDEIKEEPVDSAYESVELKNFVEPMMLGEDALINPFTDNLLASHSEEISKLLNEDVIGNTTEVHTPAEKDAANLYFSMPGNSSKVSAGKPQFDHNELNEKLLGIKMEKEENQEGEQQPRQAGDSSDSSPSTCSESDQGGRKKKRKVATRGRSNIRNRRSPSSGRSSDGRSRSPVSNKRSSPSYSPYKEERNSPAPTRKRTPSFGKSPSSYYKSSRSSSLNFYSSSHSGLKRNSSSHSMEGGRSKHVNFDLPVEQENSAQTERRILHVSGFTKKYYDYNNFDYLMRRFSKFGKVEHIKVFNRPSQPDNKNFSFVYFEKKSDANRALDEGNLDEHLKLNLNFGGRRDFCKRRYEDLDEEHLHHVSDNRDMEEDFDYCLQQMQRSNQRKQKSSMRQEQKKESKRELTEYTFSDDPGNDFDFF